MVYYFTSSLTTPPARIYAGKDKFENEELIKFGLEDDVWFHVENLSSAHIYLRLSEDQSWDDLPEDLLIDCAQLTKANSIEGNKKSDVSIIYTPWTNLKKDGSMVAGQVGFKDNSQAISRRENSIVNRLNKTREEKFPDLHMEKESILQGKRKKEQATRNEERKEAARKAQKHKELKWQKDHAYDELFEDPSLGVANNQDREDLEDDFM
ncbi:Coiled-coil domain-containing protein 25 [Blumeria hordei DH14]|uniref:Coiled-coil domain-containing protein 25 n=1 Tax=Blumeria graminis f. sp. hordei (strain DH14) TaxID=546991 RepID=N1JAS6_BLUG1|nr:Coiled-coil domain-containing protein 25 [Blumeria hordei DH14]